MQLEWKSSHLKGLNHCGAPIKALKHSLHQIGEKMIPFGILSIKLVS